MDLSKLTKKINAAMNYTKVIEISGVKYTLRLHTHDHQKAIEAFMMSVESMDKSGEDYVLANKKLVDLNIVYALHSIDEEELPEDFDGVHRDKALIPVVGGWPESVVQILFSAVLDMKVEYSVTLIGKVKFNWYGGAGKNLAARKEELEEMREDADEAEVRRVEEKKKRDAEEEASQGTLG
jgi:hypothetical protein